MVKLKISLVKTKLHLPESAICRISKKRRYIEITLVVNQANLKLANKSKVKFSPYFFIQIPNYIFIYIWQQRHDDAKLLRWRSHLSEFCHFLYLYFVIFFVFLTKYPRATQVFNWTHKFEGLVQSYCNSLYKMR